MTTGSSTILEKKEQVVIGPPPKMHNVVVHNNPTTNMIFVIGMLTSVFNMNRETATIKMMEIHTKNRTSIGPFVKDIAETRKEQCMAYAARADREQDRALVTTTEPAP